MHSWFELSSNEIYISLCIVNSNNNGSKWNILVKNHQFECKYFVDLNSFFVSKIKLCSYALSTSHTCRYIVGDYITSRSTYFGCANSCGIQLFNRVICIFAFPGSFRLCHHGLPKLNYIRIKHKAYHLVLNL